MGKTEHDLPHHVKERIRHQKLKQVLDQIIHKVPKPYSRKKESKDAKLRRVILYIKFLKHKLAIARKDNSTIKTGEKIVNDSITRKTGKNTLKNYLLSEHLARKAQIVFLRQPLQLSNSLEKSSTIVRSRTNSGSCENFSTDEQNVYTISEQDDCPEDSIECDKTEIEKEIPPESVQCEYVFNGDPTYCVDQEKSSESNEDCTCYERKALDFRALPSFGSLKNSNSSLEKFQTQGKSFVQSKTETNSNCNVMGPNCQCDIKEESYYELYTPALYAHHRQEHELKHTNLVPVKEELVYQEDIVQKRDASTMCCDALYDSNSPALNIIELTPEKMCTATSAIHGDAMSDRNNVTYLHSPEASGFISSSNEWVSDDTVTDSGSFPMSNSYESPRLLSQNSTKSSDRHIYNCDSTFEEFCNMQPFLTPKVSPQLLSQSSEDCYIKYNSQIGYNSVGMGRSQFEMSPIDLSLNRSQAVFSSPHVSSPDVGYTSPFNYSNKDHRVPAFTHSPESSTFERKNVINNSSNFNRLYEDNISNTISKEIVDPYLPKEEISYCFKNFRQWCPDSLNML